MASLSLENISKIYPNGFEAVKDFNLEIEDKDFIIFVGPSGCGKSTTLRMIAGLEDISLGTLKIDDKVVNDVEAKDRDIAMVFQSYALYPHLSVYDNMAFGLKLKKVPKDVIDEKVKYAAKILDLEKLLDRKPKALSGGQRQRVAMGRAIVREPKVFLMDEPLSNLDAKLRVQMRTEISKLHERLGATMIYVTHDQTEAMTLGTKIVVMKDGIVQQVDTPQNLYNYPKNKFVAGFIGSPQMNFIDTTVCKKGDKVTLKVGNYELELPEAKGKVLVDSGYVGKEVYIKEPNYNGYRSLHLDIRVPVYLSDRTEYVVAEIQLRTIAMDFWASLEHDIRYKVDKTKLPEGINEEMFDCAGKIAEIDRQMQDMYRRIKATEKAD